MALKKINCIASRQAKVFEPRFRVVEFFLIGDEDKSLLDPIGIVESLPYGGLEALFQFKDGSGRIAEYWLDRNTRLQQGMEVILEDLIGEILERSGQQITRFALKQDLGLV